MDHNQLVESLVRTASISAERAKSLLEKADWNLEKAVELLSNASKPKGKTTNQLMFSMFRQFLDKAEADKRDS